MTSGEPSGASGDQGARGRAQTLDTPPSIDPAHLLAGEVTTRKNRILESAELRVAV